LLGRGRKKRKDQDEEEFKKEVALTELGGEMPPQSVGLTQDYIYSLGRSVYMIMDPEVNLVLNKKPYLKTLIPAFSHLNRISRIGKQEADLLELDYEFLMLIHKLNMNEDEYENKGWAELESLKLFARHMIHDSFGGWKGNLLTEQVKIIKAELEKPKKKRLPF